MTAYRLLRYPYARRGLACTVALTGAVLVASCSETRPHVLADDSSDEAAPPVFAGQPADAATERSDTGLTEYCPSNKCPSGHTTCTSSRFPCDVNLLADRNNCGECGFACPREMGGASYECIDGRCLMNCQQWNFDCDGFPDNGCESNAASNDSCGGCGIACTDPAKPCIERSPGDLGCGCKDDKALCSGQCVDVRADDANCSTCGNQCPRDGGPALDPALHTYYGCINGECGSRKCEPYWADCDGDRDNGCETKLVTAENCGACGNACPAGRECRGNPLKGSGECMCPEGLTICGALVTPDLVYSRCVDTASDFKNCGGCDIFCRTPKPENSSNICVNGLCQLACGTGQADCNGDPTDGCEITIDSDPRNCGGCGILCDAIAGQACVGGRCVVEPCNQVGPDAGVVAK